MVCDAVRQLLYDCGNELGWCFTENQVNLKWDYFVETEKKCMKWELKVESTAEIFEENFLIIKILGYWGKI